jgi:hypothetical protein
LFSLLSDIGLVLSTKLFFGKSAAWYLVLLASVYWVSRHLAFSHSTETAESAMANIERYTHYDFRDENHSAQSPHTRGKVASFFPTILKTCIVELFSVVVNAFLFLVFLPEKVPSIIAWVRTNSVDAGALGWVCAFGTFDVSERGFVGMLHHREKVLRSLMSFQADNESAPSDGGQDVLQIDGGLLPRPSSPLMRTDFGSNEALNQIEAESPLSGFLYPSAFGEDV